MAFRLQELTDGVQLDPVPVALIRVLFLAVCLSLLSRHRGESLIPRSIAHVFPPIKSQIRKAEYIPSSPYL